MDPAQGSRDQDRGGRGGRQLSSRGRPPAITDVAAVAGVSYQTVSRVINDQPGVRPATRERVLAAMEELHYQPNSLARSLVSGRSRVIGVISPSWDLFGPNRTLHTVDEAVRQVGYSTVIARVGQMDEANVREAARQLRSRAVDGIVIAGSPHPDASRAVQELHRQIPLIVLGRAHKDVPIVETDARAGARKAVRHLLGLGHRTVWHVTGPTGWPSARQRVAGWQAELVSSGAEVPTPLAGDWSPKAGYEAGLVLARRQDVTAVFAANDHIAIGLLRAFNEAGRSVPGDVSVVGFDDIPEAAYLVPALTTMRQDFDKVGEQAVSILLQEIEGHPPDRPRRQHIPRLVVRSSTAPPPR